MGDITGTDPSRHKKLVTTFREQIGTSKAFLPDCLQQPLTADSFEDSVRGESPDLPKNYATYLAAAKLIPNLVTENLLPLRILQRKHGGRGIMQSSHHRPRLRSSIAASLI